MDQRYRHLVNQLRRFSPYDNYERCGLLMWSKRRGEYWLREMPNIHGQPEDNYAISRTATVRFLQRQWGDDDSLHGFLHTHPGIEREHWSPSDRDLQEAARLRSLTHVVYHPLTRVLTFYSEAGPVHRLRVKPKWRTA